MNSSIYQCKIFHKRLKPIERKFSYSVFMLSLDLDELDSLHDRHWLFSRNSWNIYSIYDADYLAPSTRAIKRKIVSFLQDEGIDTTKISRFILQTFPRVFGYQFNPVSFYYLEDSDSKVIATVAEVGNTYLEKKLFLITETDNRGWYRSKTQKNFYVSPFSKVDDNFDFQIGPKDKKWSVNINDLDEEGIVLVSTIRGKQKKLTTTRLLWFVFRYPLLTIRIIFLIHWHALLMWIKKIPISNKEQTTHQQTEVLRPHKSLTKK